MSKLTTLFSEDKKALTKAINSRSKAVSTLNANMQEFIDSYEISMHQTKAILIIHLSLN